MFLRHVLTQSDNQTYDAIRVLGFVGMGLIGIGIVIGAAPAEIGIGAGAIITAIGGSIRLKKSD